LLTDKLSFFKKRVVRLCYPFFVFPLFVFFIPLVLFPSYSFAADILSGNIQEIRTIAKSGAVSLALQSIDSQQEVLDIKNNLKTWLVWERERLNIYKSGQRWNVLQQRIAGYAELPDDFYFWAKQQQVDALLILKQGQASNFARLNLV